MNVSISVGFALAPLHGIDAATLLQRANIAMDTAKAASGSGFGFYEATHDANSTRRLALGNELRAAIAEGQLYMVYQPKVRLADGHMIGVEALIRWRHPSLGPVMPDEFIPLAERTGAINELTRFALGESLRQARVWRDQGHDWNVAVNVAMRNLLEADFVSEVAMQLAQF